MARLSKQVNPEAIVEDLEKAPKELSKPKKAPKLSPKELEEKYGIIYFDVLRDVTEEEVYAVIDEAFAADLASLDTEEARNEFKLILFGIVKKFDRASFPADKELGQIANSSYPSKKYATEEFETRMSRSRPELIRHILREYLNGGKTPNNVYYRISPEQYKAAMEPILARHAALVEQHKKERAIMQECDPEGFEHIMMLGRQAAELKRLQKSTQSRFNQDGSEPRVDPDLITSIFGDNEKEAELHNNFSNGIRLRQASVAKV